MGRLEEAANAAGRRYRWGRMRFYLALVMLGVITVAFALVAAVYAQVDVADADEAVAAGLIGAVACPAIAVWGVHRLSGASPRQSFRQTSPLLLLGALLLIGLGLWHIAVGNGAAGACLVIIAVADVVAVVVALTRGSANRTTR